MSFACPILVCILVAVIYLFFTWNFKYWNKYGIAYENPSIFFGNLKDAFTGKINIGIVYGNLYKKFDKVLYFGYFKLRSPALVIRNLDIIKNVLVNDFNSFANNDFHINPDAEPILAGNPFVVTGDEWKHKRSQWATALTANRIKLMHGTMSEKCNIMVDYLNNHIKHDPQEPIEARILALKYLTDVIVNSVLGIKLNTFEEPDNVFMKIVSNLFVSDFWNGIKIMCYIYAPWFHKIIGYGFVNKTLSNQLLDISRKAIEIRRKHGFLENDFFEVLMKNDKVDEMEFAGRAFGFISEGIETTSGLISFTLYELAVNPHIQAKLRQEINETAAANDDQLSFDNIHGMQYLDKVILEVSRLHPPVFTFNKICTKPFDLPPASSDAKPFTVPLGMTVTIPTFATQMDSEYFPDPEKFDPERFSEESKANIPKFAFLPFGEGPRICVGMHLGLTNAKTCVTHIIKNFEVRISPKTKQPLEVDPNVFVNRAVGKLWITLKKLS